MILLFNDSVSAFGWFQVGLERTIIYSMLLAKPVADALCNDMLFEYEAGRIPLPRAGSGSHFFPALAWAIRQVGRQLCQWAQGLE